MFNTEDRERASIFSAAADALEAYTSESALEAAKDPNFDPAGFVASGDTIYIQAPAEAQAATAPLVCGLLAEVRRRELRRRGRWDGRGDRRDPRLAGTRVFAESLGFTVSFESIPGGDRRVVRSEGAADRRRLRPAR